MATGVLRGGDRAGRAWHGGVRYGVSDGKQLLGQMATRRPASLSPTRSSEAEAAVNGKGARVERPSPLTPNTAATRLAAMSFSNPTCPPLLREAEGERFRHRGRPFRGPRLPDCARPATSVSAD